MTYSGLQHGIIYFLGYREVGRTYVDLLFARFSLLITFSLRDVFFSEPCRSCAVPSNYRPTTAKYEAVRRLQDDVMVMWVCKGLLWERLWGTGLTAFRSTS